MKEIRKEMKLKRLNEDMPKKALDTTQERERLKQQIDLLESQLATYREQQTLKNEEVFRWYLLQAIYGMNRQQEKTNEILMKVGTSVCQCLINIGKGVGYKKSEDNDEEEFKDEDDEAENKYEYKEAEQEKDKEEDEDMDEE